MSQEIAGVEVLSSNGSMFEAVMNNLDSTMEFLGAASQAANAFAVLQNAGMQEQKANLASPPSGEDTSFITSQWQSLLNPINQGTQALNGQVQGLTSGLQGEEGLGSGLVDAVNNQQRTLRVQ